MNAPNPIPFEVYTTITRFRAYGWEWRVVTDLIDYYYCLEYTTAGLRKLYTQQAAVSPPPDKADRVEHM